MVMVDYGAVLFVNICSLVQHAPVLNPLPDGDTSCCAFANRVDPDESSDSSCQLFYERLQFML